MSALITNGQVMNCRTGSGSRCARPFTAGQATGIIRAGIACLKIYLKGKNAKKHRKGNRYYSVHCKLGICIHKCKKREISDWAETSRFACWWLSPPNPFFKNFIFDCSPFRRLFVISPYRDFWKIAKIIRPTKPENLKIVLLGNCGF